MARERMSDVIVADQLRRISDGELSEGSALPAESALCAAYGVSRSVVREAITSLSAKGFLIARQGSTTIVAPRIQWNVLDPKFLAVTTGSEYFEQLQEARECFEPRMARLAAERITDEEVEALTRLERAAEDTGPEVDHVGLDVEFHALVAAATRNPVISSVHGMLAGLGRRTRSASAEVPGAIERANFWHSQVLDALRSRDPGAAEAAMDLHMRQVRSELSKIRAAGEQPADDAAAPQPHE